MGQHQLRRGLSPRQITFMALGTAIGVGLFLGSAQAIRIAGPSILFSYLVGGIMIFIMMRALGEMAVDQPISGSFSAYAREHLGPLMGYLTGWNYWTVMVCAGIAETTAVGIYMKFWYPDVPQWIWVFSSVAMVGALNLLAVKIYGELEFWFALIKVVTIVLLIGGGLSMIILGWGNGGQPIYISNLWSHGGWFPNGVSGMLLSLPVVISSFAGIEMIGISAGEAENPKETIPRAINSVLWRILIFYVGALFVILAVYPWNQIGTQGSPFVTIFEKLGILKAAGIINFVVITAALSAFNSVIFCSSRMLHGLAGQGHAPAGLTVVNGQGVPARAVMVSLACLVFGVLLNYLVPERIFGWLISMMAFGAIWTWVVILLSHYRFRKLQQQRMQGSGGFPMPAWPFWSWVAFAFFAFVSVVMVCDDEGRGSFLMGLLWMMILAGIYKLFLARNEVFADSTTLIP